MDSRYFSLLPRSAMQQTKKWTKRHSKYTFRRRCGNDQDDYRKIKQNNPRYKKYRILTSNLIITKMS